MDAISAQRQKDLPFRSYLIGTAKTLFVIRFAQLSTRLTPIPNSRTLFLAPLPTAFRRALDDLESNGRLIESESGEVIVSDPLYLSLWFSDFSGPEMLPHAYSVLQQFPFSAERGGITYLALHPVSWNEPTILERRFPTGIDPGQATLIAAELIHDDYAYVFEAQWDLWSPEPSTENWVLEPATVRFIVQGEEFDERSYEQTGHIQVDFGLDSSFLQPETSLNEQTRAKIRDNVAKLVEFSNKVEKNSGANSRLLWSESENNLAQKLIARLQRVQ